MRTGVTGKWFAVNATGDVVEVLTMSEAEARQNLPEGCTLKPWREDVDPRRHRLDGGRWKRKRKATHSRDGDPLFMRRTGYDVGAQVGALMKVVEAMLADPVVAARLPPEVVAEFEAQAAHNRELKAAHPIPPAGP